MNSNERIKELRNCLNLSQTAFGQRIGVSRDVINNYEQLRVNVPPPTERAICAEFNVNPEWLQTGKGEMFVRPANTFIDELAAKYNVDDFLKRALVAYMSLSDSEKAAVKRFIDKLTPPPEEEIYRAANSADHHKDEITKLTADEQERVEKATRMTTENSDL